MFEGFELALFFQVQQTLNDLVAAVEDTIKNENLKKRGRKSISSISNFTRFKLPNLGVGVGLASALVLPDILPSDSPADYDRDLLLTDSNSIMEVNPPKLNPNEDSFSPDSVAQNPGQMHSLTWVERAYIIFYHLHPELGKKNTKFTAEKFNVNRRTLEGWLHKESSICRWLPLVDEIKVRDLIANNIDVPGFVSPEDKVNLSNYKQKVKAEDLITLGTDRFSQVKRMSVTKHKRKYPAQEQFLLDYVDREFAVGLPVKRAKLFTQLIDTFGINTNDSFYLLLDPSRKNHPNSLHQWVRRTLAEHNYCVKRGYVERSSIVGEEDIDEEATAIGTASDNL